VADQLDRGLPLPPREDNDSAKQLCIRESGRHGEQFVHVVARLPFTFPQDREFSVGRITFSLLPRPR
jgi:hypothetical protein